MKKLEAFVAAVIITGLVGLGMLAVGVNALFNPNAVAAANAPGDAALDVSATSPDTQAQIKQLQDLVAQYQEREKQYQTQLSQYQSREQQIQSQLDQATTEVQQVQQLLIELQRRGVIRINNDGSILLPRRGFGSENSTP